MFRRESTNAQRFSATNRCLPQAVGGHEIFYDSSISAFLEWVSLTAVGPWCWLSVLDGYHGGDGVWATLTTFNPCSPAAV